MFKVFIISLFFILPAYRSDASEKIRVVTTIPTLNDLVKGVGGDRVETVSILKGGEDLHTFDPRPGDARAVANADLLIKVGIGLDNWVDRIAKASGNRGLVIIEASRGVQIIGKDRSHGHSSHVEGNPHIWHDPENAKTMLKNTAGSLGKASPGDAAYFEKNMEGYLARLSEAEKELDLLLSGIKDRRVVTYHPGWAYLLNRFRIRELFSIETTPGREPSAREISSAIDRIRKEKVKLILGEPEAPRKVLDILAKESGASYVVLAPEIGSLPGIASYTDLLRHNVREIAEGLRK